MPLSRPARRRLGNLVDQADRTVSEMIRERGGNSSNVRQAGPWAGKTLGETAEAAAGGDQTAATALKIVKQAKRLGEEH
jgi:hypothetical protein